MDFSLKEERKKYLELLIERDIEQETFIPAKVTKGVLNAISYYESQNVAEVAKHDIMNYAVEDIKKDKECMVGKEIIEKKVIGVIDCLSKKNYIKPINGHIQLPISRGEIK